MKILLDGKIFLISNEIFILSIFQFLSFFEFWNVSSGHFIPFISFEIIFWKVFWKDPGWSDFQGGLERP